MLLYTLKDLVYSKVNKLIKLQKNNGKNVIEQKKMDKKEFKKGIGYQHIHPQPDPQQLTFTVKKKKNRVIEKT